MARIRTVKPEFFKAYDLYRAEQETGLPLRLAFPGLWCAADREGRFEWVPPQLKIDVLPYDDVDFSRVLHALATRGFIVKYRVDGRDFGWIPGFAKHQIVNNRERASDLPEPNENNTLARDEIEKDASSTREPRVEHACRKEGKGVSDSPSLRSEESPPSAPKTNSKQGTEPEIPPIPPSLDRRQPKDPDAHLFARGREVLGKGAGGLITRLKQAKGTEAALGIIEHAATRADAREYVGGCLKADDPPNGWTPPPEGRLSPEAEAKRRELKGLD